MPYTLLTGATGLLGRYLLRDLTLAGVPLAVVVRRTRWESAAQRIETALAHWEDELGRALARPVVLEGDISEPCLGLSEEDLRWLSTNAESIIHSAASLTFHAESDSGEPYRSNVQGTRHVLDLARRVGIRQYHHVSTAYVCGRRRGRILESELNVGQELGNDYEQTKLTSETEALACDAFDRVTVYRPSIIVGDSRTGFTTSYHGFYTPLRIIFSLLQSIPWDVLVRGDWLARLQLAGNEHKNLVAVDWVSAAMTQLITQPERHGQTYHLTNPAPVTALEMQEAMAHALAEYAAARSSMPRSSSVVNEDFVAAFREQMRIYESYWSDDPQFDSTRTEQALPHLPCPAISREVMDRLIRFAIGHNFGWPREAPRVPKFEVGSLLEPWLAESGELAGSEPARTINLQISGPGGGPWRLLLERNCPPRFQRGLADGAQATCYLNSTTFAELARGELAADQAINTGRLVVAGGSVDACELAQLFRHVTLGDENRQLQNVLIG